MTTPLSSPCSDNIKLENYERPLAELKFFRLNNPIDHNRELFNKQHCALREFRNKPEIRIQKGDKSNIFVIMDSDYYGRKISGILSDASKFIKLDKNQILDIKQKLNKCINTVNAYIDGTKLNKLI